LPVIRRKRGSTVQRAFAFQFVRVQDSAHCLAQKTFERFVPMHLQGERARLVKFSNKTSSVLHSSARNLVHRISCNDRTVCRQLCSLAVSAMFGKPERCGRSWVHTRSNAPRIWIADRSPSTDVTFRAHAVSIDSCFVQGLVADDSQKLTTTPYIVALVRSGETTDALFDPVAVSKAVIKCTTNEQNLRG